MPSLAERLDAIAAFERPMQHAIEAEDFERFNDLLDDRQLLLMSLTDSSLSEIDKNKLILFYQSLLSTEQRWTAHLEQLHNDKGRQLRQLSQGKRALSSYKQD